MPNKGELEIYRMFCYLHTCCSEHFCFNEYLKTYSTTKKQTNGDSGIFNINLQQIFSPQNYIQYIFNYNGTPNRLNKILTGTNDQICCKWESQNKEDKGMPYNTNSQTKGHYTNQGPKGLVMSYPPKS
jgi:hypothetical protein